MHFCCACCCCCYLKGMSVGEVKWSVSLVLFCSLVERRVPSEEGTDRKKDPIPGGWGRRRLYPTLLCHHPPRQLLKCCFTSTHRNRRFMRDGNPGRSPRLPHSSWALSSTRITPTFRSAAMRTAFQCFNMWVGTWKGGEGWGLGRGVKSQPNSFRKPQLLKRKERLI